MARASTVIHGTPAIHYSEVNVQGWVDTVRIETDALTGDAKDIIISSEDGNVILHLTNSLDSSDDYTYKPRNNTFELTNGTTSTNVALERIYVDNQRIKVDASDLDGGEATVTVTWLPD